MQLVLHLRVMCSFAFYKLQKAMQIWRNLVTMNITSIYEGNVNVYELECSRSLLLTSLLMSLLYTVLVRLSANSSSTLFPDEFINYKSLRMYCIKQETNLWSPARTLS